MKLRGSSTLAFGEIKLQHPEDGGSTLNFRSELIVLVCMDSFSICFSSMITKNRDSVWEECWVFLGGTEYVFCDSLRWFSGLSYVRVSNLVGVQMEFLIRVRKYRENVIMVASRRVMVNTREKFLK